MHKSEHIPTRLFREGFVEGRHGRALGLKGFHLPPLTDPPKEIPIIVAGMRMKMVGQICGRMIQGSGERAGPPPIVPMAEGAVVFVKNTTLLNGARIVPACAAQHSVGWRWGYPLAVGMSRHGAAVLCGLHAVLSGLRTVLCHAMLTPMSWPSHGRYRPDQPHAQQTHNSPPPPIRPVGACGGPPSDDTGLFPKGTPSGHMVFTHFFRFPGWGMGIQAGDLRHTNPAFNRSVPLSHIWRISIP